MERGWVKLWRKTMDSVVFADPELFKLFCLCLLNANHEDRWVHIEGLAEPIRVLRGQFITGRFALHADYYPKKRKSNKSPRTVWRWLHILKNLEKLTLETSSRFTLVTLCHWSTYQDDTRDNVQVDVQPVSSRCPAGVQPVSTNKNVQELEELKEERLAREASDLKENGNGDSKKQHSPEALREVEELAVQCYGAVSFQVMDWLDHYEPAWIVQAMKITSDMGKRAPAYTQGILERWRDEGGMDQQGVDFDYIPIV